MLIKDIVHPGQTQVAVKMIQDGEPVAYGQPGSDGLVPVAVHYHGAGYEMGEPPVPVSFTFEPADHESEQIGESDPEIPFS